MNELEHALARLEIRLQALVEGGAARLFPGGWTHELPRRMLNALYETATPQAEGGFFAPIRFTLTVHPQQAQAIEQTPMLLVELAEMIQGRGRELGMDFISPPVIEVVADESLDLQAMRVEAQLSQPAVEETQAVQLQPPGEASNALAYLIIEGIHTFPLTNSVVNIGRQPDNHLVCDQPQVSRYHAQLRAIRGRYVLFDLDSTGGSFVNGQRITQAELHPGDVLSLAGVTMIFGQETPGMWDETQPMPASKGPPPQTL